MKKILLLFGAMILVSIVAISQVRVGVNAGGLLTGVKSKFDGQSAEGEKSIFGFKIGGIAKVSISDQFSFMPEINFVSKGGKSSSTETITVPGVGTTTTKTEEKATLSFVEIPLNLAFTSGAEGGFFGGLGPVISLGISGKDKFSESITSTIPGFPGSSTNGETKIKFDGKKDATDDNFHLKGFEFGGNIFAGYQLSNGFFIKAMYHTGFSNLSPEDKTSFKTNYFGIGIGFLFGGYSE